MPYRDSSPVTTNSDRFVCRSIDALVLLWSRLEESSQKSQHIGCVRNIVLTSLKLEATIKKNYLYFNSWWRIFQLFSELSLNCVQTQTVNRENRRKAFQVWFFTIDAIFVFIYDLPISGYCWVRIALVKRSNESFKAKWLFNSRHSLFRFRVNFNHRN